MFTIAMRVSTWTLTSEPYARYCNAGKQNGNVSKTLSGPSTSLSDVRLAMWNAFDLCHNLRGIGWNWSKGLYIPRPMFKIESRMVFAALSFIRFILCATGLGAMDLAVRAAAPEGSGGWSIFDPTLPPLRRYLRSSIITVESGFAAWMVMETMYQFYAFTFTILFQQQPAQWPPVFDQPLFATSLARFWARCWHQMFREWFVAFGSRPLEPFLGPYAAIGAFILSGIFHEIGLRGMDRGGDIPRIVGYFVMNGVGVALERLFRRLTGKRVGGVAGFLWMWTWQILWGCHLIDVWTQKGMIARSEYFPPSYNPATLILNAFRRAWEARTT